MNDTDDPKASALTLRLLLWLLLVATPLFIAGAAWLWIELCKAMFVAGVFLALPAALAQEALSWYAAPLRHLLPGLCFAPASLSKGLLPCSAAAWFAVAAYYSVIALVLGALVRTIAALRRDQ